MISETRQTQSQCFFSFSVWYQYVCLTISMLHLSRSTTPMTLVELAPHKRGVKAEAYEALHKKGLQF